MRVEMHTCYFQKAAPSPLAPKHLAGQESTRRRLARRLSAVPPECWIYTAPKLLPLPASSELSLRITSCMAEARQGQRERQTEPPAPKVPLPRVEVVQVSSASRAVAVGSFRALFRVPAREQDSVSWSCVMLCGELWQSLVRSHQLSPLPNPVWTLWS